MEFSSFTFLFVFLPAVVMIYFITPRRFRNLVLFAASMAFYTWSEPFYILLLAGIILLDYLAGRLLHHYRNRRIISRIVLILTALIHAVSLLAFKYQIFFPDSLSDILTSNNMIPYMLIPLGISVYTFQGLSYVIDLYLKKIKVQKNIIKLGLSISFFPQMVCGPIVRYSDVSSELQNRQETLNKAAKGYSLFIRGLAKKLLLADSMLYIWNTIKVMNYQQLPIVTAWMGIAAFSFAIYFYFAGYSDMARGIGKIFGFELPINFNYPYVAKSAAEFWRRWNVTLTVWYKTYLFTPLGKNHTSFFFTSFKLLALWVLMGLWYGGRLNYVLWGLCLGMVIIFEKIFLSSLLTKIPVFFQRLYTIVLILLGWVIFAVDTPSQILSYFKAMFTGEFLSPYTIYLIGQYGILFIVCILCSSNVWYNLGLRQEHEHPQAAQWFQIVFEILLTVICLVYLISGRNTATGFFLKF